ncbi:hypothetical protein BWK59_11465 [Flavobacterium davisii]|uniref:Glycosyltransferase 2-like domain-containing protein n=1 Tax=Flavobacterium davisii TaxID=2906077 RepID=A0A246GGF0_9FLAO|nr:glycosyltransferase family A protein [Flavobacterium davisii]OWP83254.1 hypothetical protein BWK59_11465 [Flavobacterium davisii]
MILVIHNTLKVVSVLNDEDNVVIEYDINKSIAQNLYETATNYPEEIIVWCLDEVEKLIDKEYIKTTFRSNRKFISYNPYKNYLPDAIGYIEESPFININKEVKYSTWQMTSLVGAVRASTLLLIEADFWNRNVSFDYTLNSIAKNYQPFGLFCESDPNLIIQKVELPQQDVAGFSELFQFVKEHYKLIWSFLLFFNLFIYEKKWRFVNLFSTLFHSRIKIKDIKLNFTEFINNEDKDKVDVIIPTIGRKKYLYDFLCDLKKQILLPVNVIIVEQNPLPDSHSELEFLKDENWPFVIKHTFTHQTGACNARNIALNKVESEWCFLADDDIRIEPAFLKEGLTNINQLDVGAAVFNCFQKDEVHFYTKIAQTIIFGSGCSIFNREKYKHVYFDEKLEFGFGEDIEYGMQLRNGGCNVVYLPEPTILHLKAPIGGFRTKFQHPWANDKIKPKPSPTIMYVKKKYLSKKQILGYRTVLFLKFYKVQNVKNPFVYFLNFKKQWKVSENWALKLKKNEV